MNTILIALVLMCQPPAPPPPSAELHSLIGRLGSPTSAAREVAQKALTDRLLANPGEAIALRWAAKHRDAEVRWRADLIATRLARCDLCNGLGRFGERPDPQDCERSANGTCLRCDGTGIDRAKLPWETR